MGRSGCAIRSSSNCAADDPMSCAGCAIAVNDVQGDLMDARSHNLFAKAGWNIDGNRRLQLSANRYELLGNNDRLTQRAAE